jgi:hypothetical protein
LRSEALEGEPAAWYGKLAEYVADLLQFLPCRFELTSDLPDAKPISLDPGWVDCQKRWAASIAQQIRATGYRSQTAVELLPRAEQEKRRSQDEHRKTIARCATESLRWRVCSADLPDGLGTYELALPHFDLPHGKSLGFLNLTGDPPILKMEHVGEGYCLEPATRLEASWKGVAIDLPKTEFGPPLVRWDEPAFARVNWTSARAGEVAVNRNVFTASERALKTLNWLGEKVREIGTEFLRETADSPFSSLNSRLLGLPPVGSPTQWAHFDPAQPEIPKWKPVQFPCIDSDAYRYEPLPGGVEVNGRSISILRHLGNLHSGEHYAGPGWTFEFEPPDRIVARQTFDISEFWTRPPKRRDSPRLIGFVSGFPPKWRSVAGTTALSNRPVWNEAHPLVKTASDEAYLSLPETESNLLGYKDRLLADRAFAAAWVMRAIAEDRRDIWLGIRDREPALLERIWRNLFGHRIDKVLYLRVHYLDVLSSGDWQREYNAHKVLPDPGPEWTLVEKKRRR